MQVPKSLPCPTPRLFHRVPLRDPASRPSRSCWGRTATQSRRPRSPPLKLPRLRRPRVGGCRLGSSPSTPRCPKKSSPDPRSTTGGANRACSHERAQPRAQPTAPSLSPDPNPAPSRARTRALDRARVRGRLVGCGPATTRTESRELWRAARIVLIARLGTWAPPRLVRVWRSFLRRALLRSVAPRTGHPTSRPPCP